MSLDHLSKLKNCKECGKELSDPRSLYCMSCSKKGSRNPMFGKKSPINKGGSIGKAGYRFIWINGKKTYEHRYVMEQFLKRKLTKDEVVHHINGNRSDNRIKNLKLYSSNSKHQKEHIGRCYNKNNSDKQRQCFICKNVLPLNDKYFGIDKGRMFNLSYICKECIKCKKL